MGTKQAKACYLKKPEPASAGFVPIDPDFESGGKFDKSAGRQIGKLASRRRQFNHRPEVGGCGNKAG